MGKLNEHLDENNPAHKIVIEMNNRNEELYGPYHNECSLFQEFCRCKNSLIFENMFNLNNDN